MEDKVRNLVCELCRQFFQAGWVTGTGGSISIRLNDVIFMTPSGVQKERILPDELFGVDLKGNVVVKPAQKANAREPKLSDCAPLFLHAYQQRGAGAVLHSHAICCNMVTSLFDGKPEFRISHQEMIKGIEGHGYYDDLIIPIIENTAYEHELADSLGETMAKYPKSCAILVRRHGMYVWGNSWEQAKRHGECLHYLFEVALQMHRDGMDIKALPSPVDVQSILKKREMRCGTNSVSQEKRRKLLRADAEFDVVLLDIEGTTTPITFVKDILFPYSCEQLQSHLEENWKDSVVQNIVRDVRLQHANDVRDGLDVPAELPSDGEWSVSSMVQYCTWCVKLDRKITPIKKLQGLIWEQGYKSGKLTSDVYSDVPGFLRSMEAQGIRVCIYSSGSKYAQQLLFGHSNEGNLLPYINAYFDTSVGPKANPESYKEILLTLGSRDASKVIFVTDVLSEATAASVAGITAFVAVRPGNAPIEEKHAFRQIKSLNEIFD